MEKSLNRQLSLLVIKKLAAKGIGFVRRSGVKILELERGHVVCEMPLKGNRNHIGTMYAGALFTLAEFPGGALFLSTFDRKRHVPIVTDLNLQFLKPAKGPIRVGFTMPEEEIQRINQDVENHGKAAFTLNGELTDRDGNVVARSQGEYQIRLKR